MISCIICNMPAHRGKRVGNADFRRGIALGQTHFFHIVTGNKIYDVFAAVRTIRRFYFQRIDIFRRFNQKEGSDRHAGAQNQLAALQFDFTIHADRHIVQFYGYAAEQIHISAIVRRTGNDSAVPIRRARIAGKGNLAGGVKGFIFRQFIEVHYMNRLARAIFFHLAERKNRLIQRGTIVFRLARRNDDFAILAVGCGRIRVPIKIIAVCGCAHRQLNRCGYNDLFRQRGSKNQRIQGCQ